MSRRAFISGGLATVGVLSITGCGPPAPKPLASYDASKITGVANTATLARWSDVSGNAQHLNQTVSGKRPRFLTGGGFPGVSFDGVDDFMQSTNLKQTLAHPFTVFVVASTRGGTVLDECPLSGDWTSASGPFKLRAQAFGGWTAQSGDPALRLSGGVKSSARNLLVAHYTANGTGSFLRKNGAQVATGRTGTSTSTSIFVGSDRGAYSFLRGTLHEIRVYTGLTTAQITNIEGSML